MLPGDYTFHEVSAPDGYKTVTDISFKVSNDGKVSITNKNGNTVASNDTTLTVTDKDKYKNPKGQLSTTVTANGIEARLDKVASVTISSSLQGVTVVDKISYQDMPAFKSYTVTGKLFEVENGVTVGDAKETKTEKKTTSKDGNGE